MTSSSDTEVLGVVAGQFFRRIFNGNRRSYHFNSQRQPSESSSITSNLDLPIDNRGSNGFNQSMNSGGVTSSSRRGKVGTRPSGLPVNSSSHGEHYRHCPSGNVRRHHHHNVVHNVVVIYEPEFFRPPVQTVSDLDVISFTLTTCPHVTALIFWHCDVVTLHRCALVCKKWSEALKRFLNSSKFRSRSLNAWKLGSPSLAPISSPEKVSNDELSLYRNVLTVKADEMEVILALDNGNVEIYDRYSLKRICLLSGQYFSSPDTMDFNSDVILVGYTVGFCGLALARDRTHTKSLGWSIFDRKSKKLLNCVEKDHRFTQILIGYDECLYVVTKHSILSVPDYGKSYSANSMTKIVNLTAENHIIEATDFGNERIISAVNLNDVPTLFIWNKPPKDGPATLLSSFPIIVDDKFDMKNCHTSSIQVDWPLALVFLTNNFGTFEYYWNRGRPFVLLAFLDLNEEKLIRLVHIDEAWMIKHKIVSFDYDSCVMCSKFNRDHLVVGFGSFSNRKDGGIGVWSMKQLLNPDIPDSELEVFSLEAPFYHWNGVDGHVGGVSSIHLDDIGMIAANSCSHQVSTRCIETYEEAKKDNVLVYDFWSLNKKDLRRSNIS